MINIDKSNMFAKGRHRECYRHPDNKDLCIKIVVDHKITKRQSQREEKYYKHLESRNISWDMIPRFYGNITTNLGTGSVFDLISDEDGVISKTLGHYMASEQETKVHYDALSDALQRLKNYLLEQRVIVSMGHRNIVCQKSKTDSFHFYVVDNIGNPEYIPFSNYISCIARNKINRRWVYLEDELLADFPQNKLLPQLLLTAQATDTVTPVE